DARSSTRASSASPKRFVAGLMAMHNIARVVSDMVPRRANQLGIALAKQLHFLGQTNLSNASAVKNLIRMGKAPGAESVWGRHGSDSRLGRHLPGVRIHVLGPPDLTQSEKIRTMRARDPSEFWHLLDGTLRTHRYLGTPSGRGRRAHRAGAGSRSD